MTTELDDKFWTRVTRRRDDDCWPWTGSLNPEGYGRMWTGKDGRTKFVHRVSYEMHVGPIPDGLVIDHLCRNRACVNPAHLEAVTDKVNVLRGVGTSAVNARKTECIHGHPFDEENTYYPPGTRGGRLCKTCNAEQKEANRESRKIRHRRRVNCPDCGKDLSWQWLPRHRDVCPARAALAPPTPDTGADEQEDGR